MALALDRALAGVCYTADTYVCEFKDAKLQADYGKAQAAFGGKAGLTPLSMSDDGRFWLFGVRAPTDPGAYYVFDRHTGTMSLVANRHPDLTADRLAPMEAFKYRARDGLMIPAYLTRPPGAPAGKPLPLIVMPHGGPEARDSLDFDIWAEFFATRGYLVLQPNFRGSAGYGHKYAEAGYHQWGGKMDDDITDGVQQLIKSGQADRSRICIFGASFGGYAALYGGAKTPELYKCVASFAGVADLNALVNWEHATKGHEGRYRYAVSSIGDPSKDAARLTTASSSARRRRASSGSWPGIGSANGNCRSKGPWIAARPWIMAMPARVQSSATEGAIRCSCACRPTNNSSASATRE